jgi:hypothetical protein
MPGPSGRDGAVAAQLGARVHVSRQAIAAREPALADGYRVVTAGESGNHPAVTDGL